jgi:hypothetical protein
MYIISKLLFLSYDQITLIVGEFATQTCFQGRHGEEMGSDQFGGQVMLHPPIRDQNLAVGRVSYFFTMSSLETCLCSKLTYN